MEKGLVEQISRIMGDWLPKEASIAVAIENFYVYFKAGELDLRIQEGDPVPAGSVAEMTFKKKGKVERLVENSLLGFPYYGIGYPMEYAGQAAALVVMLPPNHILAKKPQLRFLTGKLEENWRPVPLERVTHIESSQKKTWFYSEEEAYSTIYTLKELRHQLPDYFLPVHRSFIVNINYIEGIARDLSSNYVLTMKDGSLLPISQNYAGSIRELLGF
ncbi:LytTR family DNA-binding domain-containing protein [Planomicrobium sp. MB-3u-38]|uniref:LytTR family DNA-binding domain-containing protein n=1 Tax=Planomicrobium sp. MB-3u-38 TaxID=2058318 RepID=UPI000C7B9670|nr:LytTR family DNA-binding domain-containing protein [Planomicrobium sp. MB-3u-38]PKH10292.1 LytTR family transcriptional regulator [Planomicrobium sp. MB-3u-38]